MCAGDTFDDTVGPCLNPLLGCGVSRFREISTLSRDLTVAHGASPPSPPVLARYTRVVRVYGVKIVSADARPTVDPVFTFESRGTALFLFCFFFHWTIAYAWA